MMHDNLKDIDRKLIPRWRNLTETPKEELSSIVLDYKRRIDPAQEIFDVIKKFESDRSIYQAVEVVQLRNFTENLDLLRDAASLLIKSDKVSFLIKDHAESILRGDSTSGSGSNAQNEKYNITRLRKIVNFNPVNAVANVELARAFVTVGQLEKAENHFHVALRFGGTNRFVLRAAGRFFVHIRKQDYAWKIMKELAKYDPWIFAASLSIADMAKYPMPKSRDVIEFIDGVGNPNQTSELSAALATAELEAGNSKRAKKLFRQSAVAPTDNVVAQLQWVANEHGLSFDEKLLDVDLAFEARVARHTRSKEWMQVLENCESWQNDEPFSIRPAYEGGFVASEYLQDYRAAIRFAELGLKANPNEAGLLNNLAFFHAMTEDYAPAWKFLAQARKSSPEETVNITLDATEGMLHYRMGNIESGRALYQKSILSASKVESKSLIHLAFLHYILEELRIGTSLTTREVNIIKKIFSGKNVNSFVKEIYNIHLLEKLQISQKLANELESQHIVGAASILDYDN